MDHLRRDQYWGRGNAVGSWGHNQDWRWAAASDLGHSLLGEASRPRATAIRTRIGGGRGLIHLVIYVTYIERILTHYSGWNESPLRGELHPE